MPNEDGNETTKPAAGVPGVAAPADGSAADRLARMSAQLAIWDGQLKEWEDVQRHRRAVESNLKAHNAENQTRHEEWRKYRDEALEIAKAEVAKLDEIAGLLRQVLGQQNAGAEGRREPLPTKPGA